MANVYLCSFADSNMCISAFRFKNQAKKLKYSTGEGVFDDIFIYNEDSLPLWFRKIFNGKMYGHDLDIEQKYKNWGAKEQVRGFGYWCWKPCVILESLKQINYGDFLLYLDIGFEFCNGYDNIIEDMLNEVNLNDIMSIKINNEYSHAKYWNKMDFLKYFNLDKDDRFLNSPQIQAGFIFIKKTEKSLKVIQEWMDFFINNFNLVDDSPSKTKNLSTFIEHRHDQSVFTAIAYLYKLNNFNEDYYKEGNSGFPFLYNRNKQFLCFDYQKTFTNFSTGFIKFNYLNLDYDFIKIYEKKGNFFRRLLRLFYKFPKNAIKKYKIFQES